MSREPWSSLGAGEHRLRRSILGAGKLLGSERVPHANIHLPAQQLSPFPWNFAGKVALETELVSRENAESIHTPVVLGLRALQEVDLKMSPDSPKQWPSPPSNHKEKMSPLMAAVQEAEAGLGYESLLQ